ncbi:Transposase DDE domain-containing protein [Thalassovita taeanensis]|uniref:Transposase DDE domain-containing protein n=1 Tax=Thalassovita taeanensis TaxID=657014 RepID=A0A1H9F123_9RHOB|nr:Transposase DDE domain-containing protein [Thalassovita taeanensis]
MVAGLQYLQHAYRLSDETVIARWVETPYYQHFTGETFFQHRPPIDPSSLTHWRKRIGEEGAEWLLTKTIEAALHESEVDCISKGKARKRYEFGTKVSLATTIDEGFAVGMRALPGNPYDGHTLPEALKQVEILTGRTPALAVVDRGYRRHGVSATQVQVSGMRRGLTSTPKRLLRRHSAIEPEIGHMKTDGHLSRCPLKSTSGDAIFAVLCGCGHNIRKILAHLRALLTLILAAFRAAGM